MTTQATKYTYRWKDRHPERARESHRIAQKKWRDKNRQRVRDNMRAWNARNRAKANAYRRKQYFKQKYGITIEERDAMLVAQGGCRGCGVSAPPDKVGWVVDHDHKTGKVRGVLCNPCNLVLGHAQDDPARLRSLTAYLEQNTGVGG